MRASFMAVGGFLFLLGAGMIAVSGLASSYGFFSVAQSQLDAIDIGLKLAFVGLVLAPVGGAILAYGIGADAPLHEEADAVVGEKDAVPVYE